MADSDRVVYLKKVAKPKKNDIAAVTAEDKTSDGDNNSTEPVLVKKASRFGNAAIAAPLNKKPNTIPQK
uniref:SFRICE_008919 n=1 Tax=Spodoptera frugiperda TaxID=7108 RepID=A0A2H1VT80_SPOFR